MRIYLAGKIKKFQNDWRRELFDDSRMTRVSSGNEYDLILGHKFGGPYFVSCDHGCMHGKHSHGRGSNKGGLSCSQENEDSNVADKCRFWIDNSDVVFAWITSNDCYGTIAEIGYAVGTGKPVFIAYKEGFEYIKDMWFLNNLAGGNVYIFDSVTEALKEIIGKVGEMEF